MGAVCALKGENYKPLPVIFFDGRHRRSPLRPQGDNRGGYQIGQRMFAVHGNTNPCYRNQMMDKLDIYQF